MNKDPLFFFRAQPSRFLPGLMGLLLLAGPGAAGPAVTRDLPGDTLPALMAADREGLLPLPAPNLDRLEEAVREHLLAAREDFLALRDDPDITTLALGEAYGELGRIYHAHRLYDAAEPCYRNAERLLEKDTRWPYLLGYLYQEQARLEEAAREYRVTLARYPNYTPAQLRLAQALLGTNRTDEAIGLLEAASSITEFRGAAAFWLGKAALTEGRHAKAVEWLQLAAREQPEASRIHYPLAMAYRGLGDVEAARRHLKLRGDREPVIPDPMIEELSALLTGARTRQYHAMRAIWQHQFDVAAKEFQAIVELDPSDTPARISLGRCLYLLDDKERAEQELVLALEQEPENDKAHYFLGRLLWEQGREEAAMGHFRAALDANPSHAGAQFFLADGLMRQGDFEQAARHFGKVTEALPEDLTARQRQIMALIAMGRQGHEAALARIEEVLSIYPDDMVSTQQLARILAASPDANARDGERALALALALFDRENSIENAELVAMAYAELGQFEQAVAYQQSAIDALASVGYQYGGYELIERLQAKLTRYRENRAYRIP
uniref:Tetratricopeptide repeat-containing protein n=1 Tax=Candidatus Kentrum sp. DK TaxID=2126562 RepID=A0A450SME3_9GAMM|nr:MAG: Tetratricopeptide repeat-containing protein [Candidatus Kentron sp. DK]